MHHWTNVSLSDALAPILDEPPGGDRITDYDRRHLMTYLRLLDADRAGADPDHAARTVLRLDPVTAPEHARCVHRAHLERARWMTTEGYRRFILAP